jgi:hypothetical protein
MLLAVILCQKCDLWSRFGGWSEFFTEAGPRWVVSLGEGYVLWRGVVGLCPANPDGGGGGGGEKGGMHPVPYPLPFLEKGLGTLALAVWLLGPRSSSPMTSLVPGSLAFVYLFLVVVLGRCNRQGPIKKSPSESDTICLSSRSHGQNLR